MQDSASLTGRRQTKRSGEGIILSIAQAGILLSSMPEDIHGIFRIFTL
jgi:hypothetical protein